MKNANAKTVTWVKSTIASAKKHGSKNFRMQAIPVEDSVDVKVTVTWDSGRGTRSHDWELRRDVDMPVGEFLEQITKIVHAANL